MKIIFNILKFLSWLWIIFWMLVLYLEVVTGDSPVLIPVAIMVTLPNFIFLLWRFKADKKIRLEKKKLTVEKVKKLNKKQQKIRLEEEEEYKNQKERASWYGVEKLQNSYQIEIDKLKIRKKQIEKSFQDIYSENTARKKDSAILGGVAEGIAGTAAGIIVAANAERDNLIEETKVRENRERIRKTQLNINVDIMKQIDDLDRFRKKLKETKISNLISTEEIFENLQITEEKVEHTETGAKKITINIKNNTLYHIDGSIKAIFYNDEEKEVGYANLVFPKLGIVKEAIVSGICIDTLIDKEYKVKYEANNLWIIEDLASYDCEEYNQIVNEMISKRIVAFWSNIRNEAVIDKIKKKISEDENIYYDNLKDFYKFAIMDKTNEFIKLCKQIDLPELNYKMKERVAEIIGISEEEITTILFILKRSGVLVVNKGFIKVNKETIDMTKSELINMESYINSLGYKELEIEIEKLRNLKEKSYEGYVPGARKYDLALRRYRQLRG